MHSILALFLLLAREPFPAGYTPSPCATPERVATVGTTFPQSRLHDVATLRGYDIGQEWIDDHWGELTAILQPIWAKTATCYAAAPNDRLFCNDLAATEADASCSRFANETDQLKCRQTMMAILAGQDHSNESKEMFAEIRQCAGQATPAAERTMEWWMDAPSFGAGYPGHFTIFTIDSETRVPVQARVHVQSVEPVYSEDVPGGLPTTFYRIPWARPRLVRVPNAQGHRDVKAPEVRIEAAGYRTVVFPLPVEVPVMKVEMKPAKLRRGRNTVTVTAVDAATGAPVEARVMGGQLVLGKTNEPFTLEVRGKQPEIWVTSLYDRYSDVVVAPAGK